MPRTATLIVKLEPEAKRDLKIEAARRGTSMSEIVRAAVPSYLEQRKLQARA